MKRWLAIGSLVLGGGIAWAAPAASKGTVDLPTGVKLVGSAQVDEVRAFPEMNKTKHSATEDIVAAGAVDRTYETGQSYKDAVNYFDGVVKKGSATELSRTVTKTTTGWQLQLGDGSMQNIVVRNTKPTTIETIQAVGSVARDTFDNGATQQKSNSTNNKGESNNPSSNSSSKSSSPTQ
jgi:hypothetical protein